MRISDWSSDVCSSDLLARSQCHAQGRVSRRRRRALPRMDRAMMQNVALGKGECENCVAIVIPAEAGMTIMERSARHPIHLSARGGIPGGATKVEVATRSRASALPGSFPQSFHPGGQSLPRADFADGLTGPPPDGAPQVRTVAEAHFPGDVVHTHAGDRKSTRLNSSH